jgi:cytochrome b-561
MKAAWKDLLVRNRVWRSIFRHGYPDNERLRSEAVTSNLFLHVHPVKVYRESLEPRKTLGLGLIAFYLFIILAITGVLLMFYYIPHVDRAYQDMKDLEFVVSFGVIIRNMHRWAAHAMIVAVFLHLCRVYYTAAYREPREFNWVLGVFLFLLTLFLSLTGYLLPWDQLAYWAITIVSNLIGVVPLIGKKIRYMVLGGTIVGQNALIRFYVMHVIVLPGLAFLLILVHFWRVRKDGGLARPDGPPDADGERNAGEEGEPENLKSYGLMNLVEGKTPHVGNDPDGMVTSWPHLLTREVNLFLLVAIIIMGMSILFNAPLEEMANSAVTPNPAKAPWYFVGLQELLSWGNPIYGGILVPSVAVFVLLLVPYFDRSREGTGEWFHPSRRRAILVFTVIAVAAIALIFVGEFMRGPNWHLYWPWQKWPIH